MDRKEFIKKSAVSLGGVIMSNHLQSNTKSNKMARETFYIDRADVNFEREPLENPFGFKGGYIHSLWQVATQLRSNGGKSFIGLGVESPLWCDAAVANRWGESGGNTLMYCLSEKARLLVEGKKYNSPIEMTNGIFDEVYEYGKRVTENNELNENFALNAITPFDFAVWLMYAEENGIRTFDELIPAKYREAFSYRHKRVTNLPAISYSTSISEMRSLAQKGYFLMKIKIGAPGNTTQMLQKDMERIKLIHETIGHIKTPYTKSGKISYTFDVNGRYNSREDLAKFINYCEKIGAKDQIILIEEPFSDMNRDVSEFDVMIAVDESVHDAESAKRLSKLGYGAFALKPVPKTLSRTFKIADVARRNNIACFVADLTVNPALVEWNKNVAARLAPLPGLKTAVMETNGHQNYLNWENMRSYLPTEGASWDKTRNGSFVLNDKFYEKSGGIFLPSSHYQNLFN